MFVEPQLSISLPAPAEPNVCVASPGYCVPQTMGSPGARAGHNIRFIESVSSRAEVPRRSPQQWKALYGRLSGACGLESAALARHPKNSFSKEHRQPSNLRPGSSCRELDCVSLDS